MNKKGEDGEDPAKGKMGKKTKILASSENKGKRLKKKRNKRVQKVI
jgi:hypothetical protein